MKRHWLKLAFWNTSEVLLTRFGDAAVTLLLLLLLPTELFAELVLNQAFIAPLMILFISPSNIIYREFARWKEAGASGMRQRLYALRLYGIIAFVAALSGSALILAARGELERFWPFVWAWSLMLGIFLCGADREFLRLSLRVREVSFVTMLQKVLLIAGLSICFTLPGGATLRGLALSALASQALSALISYRLTQREIDAQGVGDGRRIPVMETLRTGFREFALWQHCAGVLWGWTLIMDLYFLGLAHLPAFHIGLYATAVKVANFASVIPQALNNLFSIWVARKSTNPSKQEGKWLVISTALAVLSTVTAAGVIHVSSPWILELFSRGRWTADDQEQIRSWLFWILIALSVLSIPANLISWAGLRKSMRKLLIQVYVPTAAVSAAVYFVLIRNAEFSGAARGTVCAAVIYAFFSLFFVIRHRRE